MHRVKFPFLIFSYPRSGSSFVSYLVDNLTSIRVIQDDKAGRLDNRGQWCFHSHLPVFARFPYLIDNTRLVFLLRDFRECVPRHLKSKSKKGNLYSRIVKGIGCGLPGPDSIYNISSFFNRTYLYHLYVFHYWRGPKFLIRYKDLLFDKSLISVFEGLLNFFKVENIDQIMKGFSDSIDYHRACSLKKYAKSETKGLYLRRHYKLLREDDWHKISQMIQKNHPKLCGYLEDFE